MTRFGVSLDRKLLQALDQWLQRKGCASRSQAIGELIRGALVKEEWRTEQGIVVGTLTLVYNPTHHVLSHTLTKTQHAHHAAIISAQHIHLDEHHCLEVIVLKGQVREIQILADHLRSLKGVKHGQFIMTTSGAALP